ncbi:MAG TPA: hypothetical protein VM534_09450, partial [Thermoanaerobaculia bacterium]|nr:hypothetical protein [Thermoanaerobaculia bacterium]
NGFISRINAEDHQIETRWIDGAADNVMLSAPKGMALVGAELWVTDIDVVRRFDRQTGEPRGEIPVPGSTFLNDLATASESSAYVTDSGMTAGEGGFEPAGTDAVYRVDRNGEIETLASGADLRGPNGVAADDRGVWVVTFGANELYRLADGARADVTELPAGSLDGLVILEDGSFLVSSWDANAVYRGKPGETFRVVVPGVNSPADLGHDPTRDLILVPLFMENAVLLIPESTAADSSPAAESATE